MTAYVYNGPSNRAYPGFLNPETGAVLHGIHPNADSETGAQYPMYSEPGEPIEFGDELPPADGYWYDTSSGLPYTGGPVEPAPADDLPASEPPSGTGADQDKEE